MNGTTSSSVRPLACARYRYRLSHSGDVSLTPSSSRFRASQTWIKSAKVEEQWSAASPLSIGLVATYG
eukprot:605562-Prymnesium_polylepis.1